MSDLPLLAALAQMALTFVTLVTVGAFLAARQPPTMMDEFQEMVQRVNAQQAEIDVLRRSMDDYATALARSQRLTMRMADHMRAAGLDLPDAPQVGVAAARMGRLRPQLFDAMSRYFSVEELHTLAYTALDVRPGEVKAETVQVLARELLYLAERRGLVDDLRRQIERERPHVAIYD